VASIAVRFGDTSQAVNRVIHQDWGWKRQGEYGIHARRFNAVICNEDTDVTREARTAATDEIERSPIFYARIAGFIYLFAMALAIFSQSFVLGKIVVPGDAAATAGNILAFEGLYRLGIVVDVITFVSSR